MTIPDEVDIIVVGGGSCGYDAVSNLRPRIFLTFFSCVVAGRLANLDHNLSVLLIEGGENNLNNPWYAIPFPFADPISCKQDKCR